MPYHVQAVVGGPHPQSRVENKQEKPEISRIMGDNNGAFRYSNAHSNSTVRWSFKTEHSAFKAVVTRVTFVTRVTMFRNLWFGVKRPDMCNIVTISSSTIGRKRIITFNASFQGFKIFIYFNFVPVFMELPRCSSGSLGQ